MNRAKEIRQRIDVILSALASEALGDSLEDSPFMKNDFKFSNESGKLLQEYDELKKELTEIDLSLENLHEALLFFVEAYFGSDMFYEVDDDGNVINEVYDCSNAIFQHLIKFDSDFKQQMIEAGWYKEN